jgi:type IV secretion system protein VirD4
MSFGQMFGLYVKVCIVFSVACFMAGLITALVKTFHRDRALNYDPPKVWDGGFATEEQMARAGLFDRQSHSISAGFVNGREFFYTAPAGQLKPVVTFGGMGSFKTTATHIPIALTWPESMVIIETTAETAIVAAEWRKRYGPVYIVNPANAHEEQFRGLTRASLSPSAHYWLDPRELNFDPRAMKLALSVVQEEQTREPYFNNTTRQMFQVIIMGLAEIDPRNCTIPRAARIITEDGFGFCQWASTRVRHPLTRAQLVRFARAGKSDIRSIREVEQNSATHVAPFLSPGVIACHSRDQVRIGDCRRQVQTIILLAPLETQGAYDRLKSFWLSVALSELQSHQFDGPVRTIVLVDEAAQLGRNESLALGMSSLRKFNSLIALAINDYGTLQHLYGKEAANTFINNAGLVQWASVKDEAGCQMLSRMLGEYDVIRETKSMNEPVGDGRTTMGTGWKQEKRPLLAPWEIAQKLGPYDQICFLNTGAPNGVLRPILCQKVPYFKTALASRARRNPFAGRE